MELKKSISWHHVTLGQFIEFTKLLQNKPEDELEFYLAQIKLFYDISEDELPLSTIKELYSSISFLNGNHIPETELKEVYEVNGRKYKFDPIIGNLTGNRWIDLQALLKDSTNIASNKHKILATIMQPMYEVQQSQRKKYFWQKKKEQPIEYAVEKYLEKTDFLTIANDMLSLSFPEVNTIESFFSLVSHQFAINSISWLETKMKKELKQVLKQLQSKKKLTNKEATVMKQVEELLGGGDSGTSFT